MISCTITKQMSEKIHFFHEKFKGKEWSGPAWFQAEMDEHGYPVKFRLIYFHVIDISTAGETEWNQTAFTGILPGVIATMVANGVDPTTLLMGNIHSHHQMRAFFSGTDTNAMHEHAPQDGFWTSIIVSTSNNETKNGSNNTTFSIPTNRCGAISYRGRFNKAVIDYEMNVQDELHSFEEDAFADEIKYALGQTKLRKVTNRDKKGNGYTKYSPLDQMSLKEQGEITQLMCEFVGTKTKEEEDDVIAALFKYFQYYYGIERLLEDEFGCTKTEVEIIKKRWGWDFGAIPTEVKNGKCLPKDCKSGYFGNQSTFLPAKGEKEQPKTGQRWDPRKGEWFD